MNTKHTPGPLNCWPCTEITKETVWIVSKTVAGTNNERVIAECSNQDDATLYAAAPELLEALKDMLSGWRYIRQTHGDLYGVGWDRAENAARAAIAKATNTTKH